MTDSPESAETNIPHENIKHNSKEIKNELIDIKKEFVGIDNKAALEIINLRDKIENLKQVVERDDLTGALNRRGLANRLNEERSRAARSGGTITLFMGDIDNFKQFNEDYGYPAGDSVLQAVHYALVGALRLGDHGARWGGDEVAGYMVDTTADDIEQIRENIPKRMAEKIPYALGHLLPDEFAGKKEEISEKLKITLEFSTVDPNDLPQEINNTNIESIYKSVMAKEQEAKRDKRRRQNV